MLYTQNVTYDKKRMLENIIYYTNQQIIKTNFLFYSVVDGQLSNREFVAVMKNRVLRGLEKPKDTGFVKLIQSLMKCAKNSNLLSFDK